MTDGILLAEMQRDRTLRRYDTIIIDEAHERSLNIDFLLGYLKAAAAAPAGPQGGRHLRDHRPRAVRAPLRRRARYAGAGRRGLRPHLPGRGALPPARRDSPDEASDRDRQIDRAWTRSPASARPSRSCGPRPAATTGKPSTTSSSSSPASARSATPPTRCPRLRLPDTEVLPLYARLSAAEQHRVFPPHPGRRIVLATNVAETSLTVPGIRYVVDTGTARISRYSQRTKVQRLPIEPVSQASARQRAGRCGRVADGVCIRLYSRGGLRVRARSSPSRRSCAPTSPRSSCR